MIIKMASFPLSVDWKGTLKKYLTRKPSMKARVGKFFLKQALFGGLAVYLGLNLVNYTKAVHVSLKPMDETPFERVIYKKENLPVLEKIIARETTLLKSLKTDVSPQERTPAVVLYRGHFEPKIRALMDVPPAVEKADLQVGRWKGVVNSPLHLYLIGLFLTGAAYFGNRFLGHAKPPRFQNLCHRVLFFLVEISPRILNAHLRVFRTERCGILQHIL